MSETETIHPRPDAGQSNARPPPAGRNPERRPPAAGRRRLRRLLLTLGPLLALAVAAYLYVTGGRYVTTENAYVKADKVVISADVGGPIASVLVRQNQPVEQGQALFRIDDTPYRTALQQAEARLEAVRADLLALQAGYRQKQEELALARTNAEFADRQLKRQARLAQQSMVSQEMLDATRHDRLTAQRQIAVTEQALAQLRAQLNDDPAAPIESHPRYREARAACDQARLDLQRTEVRAPFAGVAEQTPEPGAYVKAGDPVMAVVAERGMWIQANLKETRFTHLRPGQAVSIRIDAYPGVTWQGRVASLSQASGAEFSVLPPQNATGNWVKVVQRIPVRIAIDAEPDMPPLRAGMSARVEIDTGYQRPLPGPVNTALSWFGALSGPAVADPKRPR